MCDCVCLRYALKININNCKEKKREESSCGFTNDFVVRLQKIIKDVFCHCMVIWNCIHNLYKKIY